MDPVDPVDLARSLVDIDSTTGREEEAGRWLSDYLRRAGYSVIEQPVDSRRFNVIASPNPNAAAPAVVFSTHFDCVPPFFPSRIEGDRLHGRGAGERGEVKNHSVTCDPAKFLQASSPIRCMHQHTQADGVIKNL